MQNPFILIVLLESVGNVEKIPKDHINFKFSFMQYIKKTKIETGDIFEPLLFSLGL